MADRAHSKHDDAVSTGVRRARRAQPRASVLLSARVSVDGQTFAGIVRDIGLGGMYIEAETVPAYGKQVTVELWLDSAQVTLTLETIVRWTKEGGFGMQLLQLDARATHAIASLVHAAWQQSDR